MDQNRVTAGVYDDVNAPGGKQRRKRCCDREIVGKRVTAEIHDIGNTHSSG
jgi:hypothetical protein